MRETVAWLRNFFSKKREENSFYFPQGKERREGKQSPESPFHLGGNNYQASCAVGCCLEKLPRDAIFFFPTKRATNLDSAGFPSPTKTLNFPPKKRGKKKRKKIEGKKPLFLFFPPSLFPISSLGKRREKQKWNCFVIDLRLLVGLLGKRIDSFYKFHGNFITINFLQTMKHLYMIFIMIFWQAWAFYYLTFLLLVVSRKF